MMDRRHVKPMRSVRTNAICGVIALCVSLPLSACAQASAPEVEIPFTERLANKGWGIEPVTAYPVSFDVRVDCGQGEVRIYREDLPAPDRKIKSTGTVFDKLEITPTLNLQAERVFQPDYIFIDEGEAKCNGPAQALFLLIAGRKDETGDNITIDMIYVTVDNRTVKAIGVLPWSPKDTDWVQVRRKASLPSE